MGKDLTKMTLEELWALFPIFLVPHDDRWKDSFNEIRQTQTGVCSALYGTALANIGNRQESCSKNSLPERNQGDRIELGKSQLVEIMLIRDL